MNDLSVFNFENASVRVIVENNDPWFNANDVCEALELANPRDALAKHVDSDDVAKRDIIDRLGRVQLASFVNESGVYALIFGSTKDSAKRFKKWVTSEVLPSIRKTGSYDAPVVVDPRTKAMIESLVRFDALEQEQKRLSEANAKLEQRLDQIETAQDHFTVVGYTSMLRKKSLPINESARVGRLASKYCRAHDIEIGQVYDPRFGYVNTYPMAVLEIIFAEDEATQPV